MQMREFPSLEKSRNFVILQNLEKFNSSPRGSFINVKGPRAIQNFKIWIFWKGKTSAPVLQKMLTTLNNSFKNEGSFLRNLEIKI